MESLRLLGERARIKAEREREKERVDEGASFKEEKRLRERLFSKRGNEEKERKKEVSLLDFISDRSDLEIFLK